MILEVVVVVWGVAVQEGLISFAAPVDMGDSAVGYRE